MLGQVQCWCVLEPKHLCIALSQLCSAFQSLREPLGVPGHHGGGVCGLHGVRRMPTDVFHESNWEWLIPAPGNPRKLGVCPPTEQYVRLEPCCSCLQLSVLCPFPERMSTLACVLPALSKAQAVVHGKHCSLAYCSPLSSPIYPSLFRPAGHADWGGGPHLTSVM